MHNAAPDASITLTMPSPAFKKQDMEKEASQGGRACVRAYVRACVCACVRVCALAGRLWPVWQLQQSDNRHMAEGV